MFSCMFFHAVLKFVWHFCYLKVVICNAHTLWGWRVPGLGWQILRTQHWPTPPVHLLNWGAGKGHPSPEAAATNTDIISGLLKNIEYTLKTEAYLEDGLAVGYGSRALGTDNDRHMEAIVGKRCSRASHTECLWEGVPRLLTEDGVH